MFGIAECCTVLGVSELVSKMSMVRKPPTRAKRPPTIKKNKCIVVSVGSCPPNIEAAAKKPESDDSDSTEVMSSSDEEERWKEKTKVSEVPSEYWHIQKLVKYMKAGNQTATTVALCCLKDYDLKVQVNQLAIMDIGGLEVLVNLLESNDLKCRLGSLTVLAEIAANIDIRKSIVDLGGIPLLINILSEPARDLKVVAAETLAWVAKVRLGRKLVRKCKGIPKLIDMLDTQLQ